MSAARIPAVDISGEYLGMPVRAESLDAGNREFFAWCAAGELRLQKCRACARLRCPPGTACPWCAGDAFDWIAVSGSGTVYSYTEVTHAIQPAFAPYTPYLVLLVELDEQRAEHEALRMLGNLTDESAALAPVELVQQVGIGSRMRVVFKTVTDGLALPMWALDSSAEQPAQPWRYPGSHDA